VNLAKNYFINNNLYLYNMFQSDIEKNIENYKDIFEKNKPFKYVVIEDFLKQEYCETLLTDFPKFNKNAKDEFGNKLLKHTITNIKNISPFYNDFYKFISSPLFLDTVSKITGINDVIFDPKMYEGGTHNNLHGQKLDTHVDFNYDNFGNHRRLNLILYLNHEWELDWGGCLELHSDPRNIEKDEIVTTNVLFNRAILFETNEYSWHGFKTINIPEEKRNTITRKSISVYFYTKTRPREEIYSPHGTFYVHYPLDRIEIGEVIDERIYNYIKNNIKERDSWIERYQKEELNIKKELIKYKKNDILTLGFIKIEEIEGQINGNWLAKECKISIKVYRPIKKITLLFYLPEKFHKFNNTNFIYINKVLVGKNKQVKETQEVTIDYETKESFTIIIRSINEIIVSDYEKYGCLLCSIVAE